MIAILREDRRAAALFLARLAWFALPGVFALLAAEMLLWRTGETWPVSHVLRVQQGLGESLFGRGLISQQFNLYKSEALRLRKPAVVALGSSRVMQFRDFMFAPLSFYNAGGIFQNAADVVAYADLVEDGTLPRPRVAIVGLDPWWFAVGAPQAPWLRPGHEQYTEAVYHWQEHLRALRSIPTRKFPWAAVFHDAPAGAPRAIGIGALRSGSGERGSDGSHLYADYLAEYARTGTYRDREQPPVVDRVRLGRSPLPKDAAVNTGGIDEVMAAFQRLARSGIEVRVVLPPVSDEVWGALKDSPRLGPWWTESQKLLQEGLSRAGIPWAALTHPAAAGLDDRTMFDGFHPGERMAVELVATLVEGSAPTDQIAAVDRAALARLRRATPAQALSYQPPGPLTPVGSR